MNHGRCDACGDTIRLWQGGFVSVKGMTFHNNGICDKAKMCECGTAIDTGNPQQVISEMCEACLDCCQ
jgi:hypothetical protein